MALLDIKKYPAKILRRKSEPIRQITARERKLFEDMLLTMRLLGGVGLAAPQVGISKRLIVADTGEGPIKLANPEIIKTKGSDKMEEGCLSIPDVKVDVERPHEVTLTGLNEKGGEIELKAGGLLARILQHEIDHLNGKLIIDYMGLIEKLKLKIRKR